MATTKARSIGTRASYSTGTLSTDATGLIVTLSGGVFDSNWGEGDKLTILGAFDDSFSDDFFSEVVGYVLTRDSNIQLTMQSALPANMTAALFTIERAYPTLPTWEAACPADLVADDSVWKGVMYSESVFNLTTNIITISGITTDTTRYPWLTAATGHKHNGVIGAGVQITCLPLSGGRVFQVDVSYFRMCCVDISDLGVSSNGKIIEITSISGVVKLDSLIVRNFTATAIQSNTGNATEVSNSVMYGLSRAVEGRSADITLVKCYNCTGVRTLTYVAAAVTGFRYCCVINCIAFNYGGLSSHLCFLNNCPASNYNISSDHSAPGATGETYARGKDIADQFVNLILGAEDFSLKPGSSAILFGSAILTTDIRGLSRTVVSSDAGAYRYATGQRFWVGIDTSWNTPANWSLTSGGVGGAGVPTAFDEAIFDTASNAYAHCVADVNMVCAKLNMVQCTNNFTTSTFTLTTEFVYLDTSGNVSLTSVVTCGKLSILRGVISTSSSTIVNSSSDIRLLTAITTLTITSATLNITGNSYYVQTKTATAARWGKLTVAANKLVIVSLNSALAIGDSTAINDILVVNTGATLYLGDSGSTVSIYTGGTCTPINNLGTIYAETGYAFNIHSALAGVITLSNIGLSTRGTLLRCFQTFVGTCTFRMNGAIRVRQITIEAQAIASGCTTIFDAGVNNILDVFQINITANYTTNQNTIEFRLGTSTINFLDNSGAPGWFVFNVDPTAFVRMYLEGGVINATSAVVTAIYNLTVPTTNFIFDAGTSTLNFNGTGANKELDCSGKTLYNVFLLTGNQISFTTALSCNRLGVQPGDTVLFKEGLTHAIANYVAEDWDGTVGNLVTIKSITNTIKHTLNIPTGINVKYVAVRDSIATNYILSLTSNGCVDGPPVSTNTKWIFIFIPLYAEEIEEEY